MKLSNFDYNLPKELIAQTPIEKRDHSRLLKLDKNSWEITEDKFYSILDDLWENDVLVVNKTKVINARLHWYIYPPEITSPQPSPLEEREQNQYSPSTPKERGLGGEVKQVEIFLHKQVNNNTWDCLVYPWKKLKIWTKIHFYSPSTPKERGLGGEVILSATIKSISPKWRIVEFNKWWIEFLEIVEKLWEIPLPPYIKEKLENNNRYQTVYNEVSWSVAAPTAGLHFTPELIEKLEESGVKIEKVLLHVWLWTFAWVETQDIKNHKMHSEFIELKKETADKLNKYKSEWKRIIAVWTTSVRVLESFTNNKWILESWSKETDIFIYPGYDWKFVDSIITNFHLPKSTLLMLVSSIAWNENIKKAYNYAIENKFRFFSFWDVMWII